MFELDGEGWTVAEFVEYDNNRDEYAPIVLYVRWTDGYVNISAQPITNNQDGDVYYRNATEFTLDLDTDFTEFEEYFNKKIKPILEETAKHFEQEWDGHNMVGGFDFEIGGDEDVEIYQINAKIEKLLVEAPKHCYDFFTSIQDSFEGVDIVEYFEEFGLDILNCDLENDENIDKIIEACNENIIIIGYSRNDYVWAIENIREDLEDYE